MENLQHDPLEDALAKVRAVDDLRQLDLSDDEQAMLRAHAASSLAQEGLSPSNYAFCVRLQQALNDKVQPPPAAHGSADQNRKRTNWTLRNAIEKTRAGRESELVEFEIRLLENTLSGLRALTEPTGNHTRLQAILEESLDTYYNYYAERARQGDKSATADADDEFPHEDGANFLSPDALDCESHFRGGPRSNIGDVDGLPVGRPMQVYEHHGDLHLRGELNEDVLLIVRDGGVRIEGAVSGVVHAEGPIHLRGNLTGGTLVSRRGSVSAHKALFGSRMLAPKGSILLDSAEHPGLLYTAAELKVGGDLSGATAYCRKATVGGALRGGTVSVLDRLETGQISPGRKESARIEFRSLVSPLEYGAELTPGMESILQEYARASIEAGFSQRLQQEITADFRDLLNLVIARLSTGSFSDQQLVEMRSLQIGRYYGGLVCEAGDQLARALEFCFLLREAGPKAVLLPAIEACQKSLRTLEKEIAAQPPTLSGASKGHIEAQIGQLHLTMKRTLDAAMSGQDLLAPLASLNLRLRDWNSARLEAESGLEVLANELKDRGFAVDAVAQGVEEFAGRVLGRLAKGGVTSGALGAQLKKLIQFYMERSSSLGSGMQARRQRAEELASELERECGLLIASGRSRLCVVQPQGVANGTIFSLVPGITAESAHHAGLMITAQQFEQRPSRITADLSGIHIGEV
ncbi:MAG: hypothetical protein GC168_03810 [Candidatus Hydrogenedens sp.]|nr:hypothetical protein [Candidatus Hydrogenedens sp.]